MPWKLYCGTRVIWSRNLGLLCERVFCCTDKNCDCGIISYFRLYISSEAGEPGIFVA